jgi:hypothetical protein
MLIDDKVLDRVRGRIVVGKFYEHNGLYLPYAQKPNQIQYTWGFCAAQQLGYKRQPGRRDYSIAGMYIEYENVADPDDPVSIPTYGREEGLEYYADLLGSGVRDYIRVPLRMEPALSIAAGYESYFTAGDNGNQLTFFALSTGATGVHGKTFSSAVNSKIFGFALVAMPVPGDRTQDVIVARTYLDEADQQVKEASAQAGVTWEVIFG